MGQLRVDMHRILDEHNLEHVMVEREQKKLVKYLLSALESVTYRETIRKLMEYTQHKALKIDVVAFYTWTVEQLGAFIVWQPTAEEKSKEKRADKSKALPNQEGSRSDITTRPKPHQTQSNQRVWQYA